MKDRGRRRGVAGRRSVVERGCEVIGAIVAAIAPVALLGAIVAPVALLGAIGAAIGAAIGVVALLSAAIGSGAPSGALIDAPTRAVVCAPIGAARAPGASKIGASPAPFGGRPSASSSSGMTSKFRFSTLTLRR